MDPRLEDKTTIVKHHPFWHYLICVSFRITLGVYIVTMGTIPYFQVGALLVSALFMYKAITNSRTWKAYWRTVFAYAASAAVYRHSRTVVASLIIVDALMGLQSYHTATVFASREGESEA